MLFFPSQGYGSDLPDRIHIEKGSLRFIELTSLSIAEDDYSPFIDAMQTLIPTVDINDLTLPDFYALVAYARIKLYPSSPISYNHVCRNTVFKTEKGKMNSVELKKAIERKEIDRKAPVNPCRCDFKYTTYIDHIDNFDMVKFNPEGFDDVRFAIPRVSILAEYKRLIKDPKYRFIVPTVAWLKEGDTIEEKLAIIEQSDSPLELVDELSKIAIQYGFGLRNSIETECPDCDKKSALPIHIDNQSFIRI